MVSSPAQSTGVRRIADLEAVAIFQQDVLSSSSQTQDIPTKATLASNQTFPLSSKVESTCSTSCAIVPADRIITGDDSSKLHDNLRRVSSQSRRTDSGYVSGPSVQAGRNASISKQHGSSSFSQEKEPCSSFHQHAQASELKGNNSRDAHDTKGGFTRWGWSNEDREPPKYDIDKHALHAIPMGDRCRSTPPTSCASPRSMTMENSAESLFNLDGNHDRQTAVRTRPDLGTDQAGVSTLNHSGAVSDHCHDATTCSSKEIASTRLVNSASIFEALSKLKDPEASDEDCIFASDVDLSARDFVDSDDMSDISSDLEALSINEHTPASQQDDYVSHGPQEGSSQTGSGEVGSSFNDSATRSNVGFSIPGTTGRNGMGSRDGEATEDGGLGTQASAENVRLDQIQLWCPRRPDGCQGINPTISQLLRCLQNSHRIVICTRCCSLITVDKRERPRDVLARHVREYCTLRCINPECASAGITEIPHEATDGCPDWGHVSVVTRWRFIYFLVNGEFPPETDFERGPGHIHNNTRRPARSHIPRRLRVGMSRSAAAEADLRRQLDTANYRIAQLTATNNEMEETLKMTRAKEMEQYSMFHRVSAKITQLRRIVQALVHHHPEIPPMLQGWIREEIPGKFDDIWGPVSKPDIWGPVSKPSSTSTVPTMFYGQPTGVPSYTYELPSSMAHGNPASLFSGLGGPPNQPMYSLPTNTSFPNPSVRTPSSHIPDYLSQDEDAASTINALMGMGEWMGSSHPTNYGNGI